MTLIPDEVDMVLGFTCVGGGTRLSRIAPEYRDRKPRGQGESELCM